MTSREKKDAHPALQEVWDYLQPAAARSGIDIFLTCTWRSGAEQARLYAQGRTTPGMIVTNARPGQSAHNPEPPEGSHALDFGVLVSGRYEQTDLRPYLEVAKLARALGVDCGAFWTGFKDYPHIQLPDWRPGKRYGPAFRCVPKVVSIPALPPKAPPPPARPAYIRPPRVFLRTVGDANTEMDDKLAHYGGGTVTRLDSGQLRFTNFSGDLGVFYDHAVQLDRLPEVTP